MRLTIITFCATLFSTALMATETADHKVMARDGKFEIRDYPALKVARTALVATALLSPTLNVAGAPLRRDCSP